MPLLGPGFIGFCFFAAALVHTWLVFYGMLGTAREGPAPDGELAIAGELFASCPSSFLVALECRLSPPKRVWWPRFHFWLLMNPGFCPEGPLSAKSFSYARYLSLCGFIFLRSRLFHFMSWPASLGFFLFLVTRNRNQP